ncbi:hypothetical protein NLI96_g3983 [Meripilus lineatus]|uniref:D-xylose 1-dehydrogenase (NADP(+), D-xylono-1,5-lactone-forming) n=1 Tax=Meripilus lineatus TaxID=2056292 RepID=A0AAD5V5R3_9APHY|nr:hypothetical protein NLI96_g3983 [Physisporinus lineatus]
MSLSSTSTIKVQLSNALGAKAPEYWHILQQYLRGSISRLEYDDMVKDCLGRDNNTLVQLHNSLIVSLFDTSAHLAPPTPPPDVPKPLPRKRKRLLPYQGEDGLDDVTLRSTRLKRWTVGLGRRERERVKGLETVALSTERKPRKDRDEIAAERGVQSLQERGEPPGSRLPLHLASMTRAPTLQHISDRINLISAQHNLGAPHRLVSSLMMLAFEAKLKQLITQALSLTSSSHAITSIQTSGKQTTHYPLSTSSFETLFTLSPATLPNGSAAATRLALGENDTYDEEYLLKDREVKDQRWQLFALLGERSTSAITRWQMNKHFFSVGVLSRLVALHEILSRTSWLTQQRCRDVQDVLHKVVAVGSRSVQKAQDFIQEHAPGIQDIKPYGTYEEVYADPNVDVIYIGTPHTLHYENARDALLANKHVLCEKATTSNAAELRDLLKLAKERNRFFMEAMWTRFQPLTKEVKKIAEDGILGDPVLLHADLSGDFDIDNIPKTDRILDPMLGGGALLDLGPYPMVWAVIGLYEHPSNKNARPSKVTGNIVKTKLTGVDSSTAFVLNFTETLQAQAILSCSITLPPASPGVIIRYRNGNIHISSPIYRPKSFVVQYFDKPGSGVVVKEEKRAFNYVGNGWCYEADEVARCVRDGKLESDLWGHEKSLLLMDVFDEVRRQGEYKLPDGVEKVLRCLRHIQNTSDTPFTSLIPAAPTPSLPTPDPSQAAGSSSQVTAPPAQPQPRQAEEARKDKSLAEFLLMLDDYEPLVPNEVTDYFLQRVGFECEDVRLKRLLSLAAQKFVSDIAADAYQHARIRTNAAGGRTRANQFSGPSSARDKTKTTLTMDDLSAALAEYGITSRKPEFYM